MSPKAALLALLVLLPLALPSAASSAPSVAVEMDQETYSIAATALGDAPIATVTVQDADGNAAAGVVVRVAFIRHLPLIGFVGNETVIGTTDANGVFAAAAPTASGLPGNYVVSAFALGSVGNDRYSVGA